MSDSRCSFGSVTSTVTTTSLSRIEAEKSRFHAAYKLNSNKPGLCTNQILFQIDDQDIEIVAQNCRFLMR